MEELDAIECFAALSHQTRLRVLRRLVRAGPQGMSAGDLSKFLDVRSNTLSSNLAAMRNAGLLRCQREGRSIRYFAEIHRIRQMADYLLLECCEGMPERCADYALPDAPLQSPPTIRPEMASAPVNVLFLCTANSARSLIAEAALNAAQADDFRAYSAGSHPSGKPHPRALALMARHDYDDAAARSKGWEEFAQESAPHMDVVITVCDDAAGEVCPIWPGRPVTAHWGVADPAKTTKDLAAQDAAFEAAHDVLSARIAAMMALPIRDMDMDSLRAALRQIAQEKPE